MAYDIKNLAKYQQEVQRLHNRHFNKISKKMGAWALKNAAEVGFYPAMYNAKKPNLLWCPICGEVFERGAHKCPHCGATLGTPQYRDEQHGCYTFKDYYYFEEVTTCQGWQIVRLWLADFKFHKGHKAEMIYLGSMFERWFNPTIGKEVLLGKYRGSFPYYKRIPWAISAFGSTEGYVHRNLQLGSYDEHTDVLYPRIKMLDFYEGCSTDRLVDASENFALAFRLLLTKKDMEITETILKIGRPQEIKLMLARNEEFKKYWRTILVSRRHGFQYEEYGTEYFDYLGQLERLHLDLRSPHYVAPSDFDAMHQQMTRRLNAIAERERREWQRRQEIERYKREVQSEEDYKKARGMYFGLLIVGKKYKVQPLKSVKEFLEEGLAMDHCVFSCDYYDTKQHPYSLILSVRNNKDERMVTIELSTKTWRIQQCYAKGDNIHPQDKSIRRFIYENIETIKSFSKPKKRQAIATA